MTDTKTDTPFDNACARLSRRSLLAAGLGAAAGFHGAARAQQAPAPSELPLRIVVPLTAGGPADVLARVVADELRGHTNAAVLVDNKPGAGTSIGAGFVARAEPDGNTLLIATAAHIMSAPMLPLRYHPVDDFAAIAEVAYQPFVLSVLADDPIRDFAGFLAEARRKPGGISLGTAGIGNASHLAGLMLERESHTSFLYVPYGGSSQLQGAMLGGQVRGSFLNPTVAAPMIQAGKLRGIAVTGKTRWRQTPDVPTLVELGFPDYECIAWYGIVGPKGMSAAKVNQLYGDIRTGLAKPANRKILADAGLDPMDVPPAQFAAFLGAEYKKWSQVIEAAGLAKKS